MQSNPARVCVPVCVQRASDLAGAIERAAKSGDLVELRLDCLGDIEREFAAGEIPALLANSPCPLILTMRSPEQGGQNSLSYEDRSQFWSSIDSLSADSFLDLELDLCSDSARKERAMEWNRVICSQHDFAGVRANLDQLYEQMSSTPARILKIAVHANDATDCLPIFALLSRARREGREMIAIAMGQAGIMTRVLGPSRGSFLTYGALDDEHATAPGQLTARELREVYRIDGIDQHTEITGLIGKPLSHSISPHIHNAGFAARNVNAVFIPFEVGDISSFMRRMVLPGTREIDWNLRGLGVTAPHKSAVMSHLDWIEPAAREIGAVNTILVEDGELHGYNTDTAGFLAPLNDKYGSLKDARCAIIGAGGAARAALWGLQKENARVVLFARDLEKARIVADEFGVQCLPIANARFDGFDILVNATPLGTSGERAAETPLTAQQVRGVRLAYDLVYNPLETQFQREARTAGCETIGGIHMLVAQAVEQFKLWTGREPDVKVMRAAALRALGI